MRKKTSSLKVTKAEVSLGIFLCTLMKYGSEKIARTVIAHVFCEIEVFLRMFDKIIESQSKW